MIPKIRIGDSEIHSYPSGDFYTDGYVLINDELVGGVTDVIVSAVDGKVTSATITFTGDVGLVGDNDV